MYKIIHFTQKKELSNQTKLFFLNIDSATTYALIPLSSLRDLRNGSTLGVSSQGKMGVAAKITDTRTLRATKKELWFLRTLFLNLDSATTYLPGRLPSEYCRRKKSLRPCSGWERVVSFCLVTEKLSHFLLSKLISESIAFVRWRLHNNKLDNRFMSECSCEVFVRKLLRRISTVWISPPMLNALPCKFSTHYCSLIFSSQKTNFARKNFTRFQEKPSSD